MGSGNAVVGPRRSPFIKASTPDRETCGLLTTPPRGRDRPDRKLQHEKHGRRPHELIVRSLLFRPPGTTGPNIPRSPSSEPSAWHHYSRDPRLIRPLITEDGTLRARNLCQLRRLCGCLPSTRRVSHCRPHRFTDSWTGKLSFAKGPGGHLYGDIGGTDNLSETRRIKCLFGSTEITIQERPSFPAW